LAKIKALPDTINAGYKNAYVRKVGSYWKVQVGAFSVKTNAARVVHDLANKGYNAFVTTI
jgi:cell division septation protein DedD